MNELPENENEDLEDAMVLDEELCDRMHAVEMNLIERYVLQEMSVEEKARFEKGFLLFPENQHKVEDARIFHESLSLLQKEMTATRPQPQKKSWIRHLASLFETPLPALTYAALALLFAAALIFLVFMSKNRDHPTVNARPTDSHNANQITSSPNENSNNVAVPDSRAENSSQANAKPTQSKTAPPKTEIAKLDPRSTETAQKLLEKINGRVDDHPRGDSSNVTAQLVKINQRNKFLRLMMKLTPAENDKNNGRFSVDIINQNSERIFPPKELLSVTSQSVDEKKSQYLISIKVPTKYLRDGEVYYFRVDEINNTTPFKITRVAAKP